jgi:DNA (cytosine-5)-methyltransferase 1
MNALSLFSGCGGDSLGMKRAGFNVVAYSEFKQSAIDSHQANFPDSVLIKDSKSKFTDITKIEDSQFEPYKGKVDLVFAGFPCQGFSKAGKKDAADPRNQMFRHFVRVVKITGPQYFIGENVTGLTSMKSGPNEGDPLMLDIIRGAFAEIGYKFTYKILEACQFGAPQKRKRCLLVGWKDSLVFDEGAYWKAVEAYGKTKTMPTLRSFVATTLEGAIRLPDAAIPEHFATYALPIPEDQEPSGTPHPYLSLKVNANLLSCSKRVSPIHSEIIDLDAPSKTIICTYDHQPRLYVGYRKGTGPSYARILLPDELKQIQGFPADYKVLGSPKDQVVQIGNAVPPQIIEALASILKGYLQGVPVPQVEQEAPQVPQVPTRKVIKIKKSN